MTAGDDDYHDGRKRTPRAPPTRQPPGRHAAFPAGAAAWRCSSLTTQPCHLECQATSDCLGTGSLKTVGHSHPQTAKIFGYLICVWRSSTMTRALFNGFVISARSNLRQCLITRDPGSTKLVTASPCVHLDPNSSRCQPCTISVSLPVLRKSRSAWLVDRCLLLKRTSSRNSVQAAWCLSKAVSFSCHPSCLAVLLLPAGILAKAHTVPGAHSTAQTAHLHSQPSQLQPPLKYQSRL